MLKEYKFLSGRLRQLDIRQEDLGRILGINATSVSHRMCGRTPWTLDEAYTVLGLCGADSSEFHIYFPPTGKGA